MTRFYDPATGTEALEGIHDTEGATRSDDMPEASREWFDRPAREGFTWKTDPTGKFPIETPTPPPTTNELSAQERAWARSELTSTDAAMLSDSPYTDAERAKIKAYRTALRNPAREAATGYPAQTWRPTFPAGVKRPGQ